MLRREGKASTAVIPSQLFAIIANATQTAACGRGHTGKLRVSVAPKRQHLPPQPSFFSAAPTYYLTRVSSMPTYLATYLLTLPKNPMVHPHFWKF